MGQRKRRVTFRKDDVVESRTEEGRVLHVGFAVNPHRCVIFQAGYTGRDRLGTYGILVPDLDVLLYRRRKR